MTTGARLPATKDPFVAMLSQRIGGPLGRRAGRSLSWWNPTRIALLTATAAWILGALQKIPCRQTVVGQYPDTYKHLCYSDIPLLYTARGLADGNIPYLDHGNYQALEYPVLTGWLLEFERRITALLGAPVGPGLDSQQVMDASNLFATVNLVVLGLLFLVAVWAQSRTYPSLGSGSSTSSGIGGIGVDRHRAWDAMMIAAAPTVMLAGFINWDMLPVALTALGFMFWARSKPGWAGAMFGLGMAAKLYPVLLLGPLILLCLRRGRMREFGRMMIGFTIAWLIPNLPVMILAPDQWMVFWTFNSDRAGDFGSIWYVLSLAGHPVPHLNLVDSLVLIMVCIGIGWLIISARRPPRFGQVAYLVIAAFLITNKVYSPQYVLWLLPLLVLARPRWREWLIFTAGEIVYYVAIWGHLDGTLGPGNGGPDTIYWYAVMFRIACECWVGAVIVRDILSPDRHDPLRMAGHSGKIYYGAVVDDPAGGVLRNAPDAPWVRRLHRWLAPGA